MSYWLLLEKSDETRISKGIDGYRDATGESYHYDSLVPNHRNIAPDDLVVLRKESEIVGVGAISDIAESADAKIHRRCPKCESTDIRERSKKQPKWKCGKCAEEFSDPKETIVEVRSFVATIKDFTRLNAPPSVKAVKMCAEGGDGSSSQLSMLRLDPLKIQTLLEGLSPSPSTRSQTTGTDGQGFGLSQAERRAVELRAMQVARTLYEDTGWEVIDMSSSQPFDLLATKGPHKRFIEVKGTTGEGLSVILTHGEVSHVRNNAAISALVIVSGIDLGKSNGGLVATGGTVSTHEDPWTLIDRNLSATQYRYEIK
jgi:ribosomal protein L37AE/L43A